MDAIGIPQVGRFGLVLDPAGTAFTVIKLIDPALEAAIRGSGLVI